MSTRVLLVVALMVVGCSLGVHYYYMSSRRKTQSPSATDPEAADPAPATEATDPVADQESGTPEVHTDQEVEEQGGEEAETPAPVVTPGPEARPKRVAVAPSGTSSVTERTTAAAYPQARTQAPGARRIDHQGQPRAMASVDVAVKVGRSESVRLSTRHARSTTVDTRGSRGTVATSTPAQPAAERRVPEAAATGEAAKPTKSLLDRGLEQAAAEYTKTKTVSCCDIKRWKALYDAHPDVFGGKTLMQMKPIIESRLTELCGAEAASAFCKAALRYLVWKCKHS